MAACASPPQTLTRFVGPQISTSLLTCKEYPIVPGEGATQRDVAGFIVVANQAYKNCKYNLQAVSEIVVNFEKETATKK